MKAKETVKNWLGPEEVLYMPNQTSVRLSVLATAKIAVLCELFPKKSKTEILEDILSVGLEQIEEQLPRTTHILHEDEATKTAYLEEGGFRIKYYEAVANHLKKLKEEQEIDVPHFSFSTRYEQKMDKDYYLD